ncbi:MAG: biotin--[acetyl-CoA-carboxylase] ligase [Sedimentisphaerales bacterium]|nr:biotin--[acetyl-CoA-carboxylase] ligase [Sedimentisphaerales bacterium]
MPINDRLDPDLILANLRTKRVGREVLVYEQTASTNDILVEYARNSRHDGLVVFAEEQTAGRGRSGARWHSNAGHSLLFSILLTDCEIGGELLSLTCAVAVTEAIGQVGPHYAAIKWPNDILLAGRKVAGILIENQGSKIKNQKCHCREAGETCSLKRTASSLFVVGIGINCHQTQDDFPPELREIATSLDLVAGTRCRRVTVARRVLTSLDHWLNVAERDSHRVTETWSRLSMQLNQRVTLSCNRRRFTGNCIGVDPEKGLILQLDRGGVRMFDAAHTHIVK